MKKILLLLVLLLLAVPIGLIATGTISATSLSMMLNVVTGRGIDTPAEDVREQRFQLADGFSMSLYAGDLPKARFIQFTNRGDLLVSRPHAGDIMLLARNPENPAIAGERKTLLQGLTRPSGLALHGEWLYVGEIDAIGRVRFDQASGVIRGDYEHIITGLTGNGNHPYKVIAVGPDEKLYLSQGSTCNVCVEEDPRRATLSRFNLDGTGEELLATGLRNSMGMDWAPWDGALYATDNGRDLLGDDYPPCELNRIETGGFYGWPYFNGANEPDPDYSEAPPELAASAIAPVHEFRAHNAPLGMRFVNTNNWPTDYDQVALVALHGSWNRSVPDGYRVVSLHWRGDKIERKDFLSGFEKAGNVIGRPVDIAQGPDGAIYISDDYAGAIYRVSTGEGGNALSISATPEKSTETVRFELTDPDWLSEDNDTSLRKLGGELYARHNCMSCHDPRIAVGNAQLAGIADRRQYDEIIDTLTSPTAPMPIFPLSEEDKRALAHFLLTRE